MVGLGRPYRFKFFKGCLPQILFGSFLNTLAQLTRLGATANGVFFSIQLLQPILPFKTLKFDCIFSIE